MQNEWKSVVDETEKFNVPLPQQRLSSTSCLLCVISFKFIIFSYDTFTYIHTRNYLLYKRTKDQRRHEKLKRKSQTREENNTREIMFYFNEKNRFLPCVISRCTCVSFLVFRSHSSYVSCVFSSNKRNNHTRTWPHLYVNIHDNW